MRRLGRFMRFYVSRGYVVLVVFWSIVVALLPYSWPAKLIGIAAGITLTIAAGIFHYYRQWRREQGATERTPSDRLRNRRPSH